MSCVLKAADPAFVALVAHAKLSQEKRTIQSGQVRNSAKENAGNSCLLRPAFSCRVSPDRSSPMTQARFSR